MATVSEELAEVTRLLRLVCRSGVALPRAVADWWTVEQQEIAAEEAAKDARKQQRIAEIQAKIADLQATLASLQ